MKEKEEERLNLLKQYENELYKNNSNIKYICGIDEAGRGSLAGPVVVGAVIMPKESFIEGINDSKKISEKKREKLYNQIIDEAVAYGIGIVDQQEIDNINILNATKLALTKAISEMKIKPDLILVDALEHINTLRDTI